MHFSERYEVRHVDTAESHLGNFVLLVDRRNPEVRARISRRMLESPTANVGRWAMMQLEATEGAALYRERFGA